MTRQQDGMASKENGVQSESDHLEMIIIEIHAAITKHLRPLITITSTFYIHAWECICIINHYEKIIKTRKPTRIPYHT